MNTLIINLAGFLLIASIIYWFILSKPKAKQANRQQPIEIHVQDGIYSPSMIQAQTGKPLHLQFIRKDEAPCAEYVIFDQVNISAKLPLNKPHNITVTFKNPGDYAFTCQMGMYRGTVLVR